MARRYTGCGARSRRRRNSRAKAPARPRRTSPCRRKTAAGASAGCRRCTPRFARCTARSRASARASFITSTTWWPTWLPTRRKRWRRQVVPHQPTSRGQDQDTGVFLPNGAPSEAARHRHILDAQRRAEIAGHGRDHKAAGLRWWLLANTLELNSLTLSLLPHAGRERWPDARVVARAAAFDWDENAAARCCVGCAKAITRWNRPSPRRREENCHP